MKILDVFSGIGGFALGLESCGGQTVSFCETDSYARKVLSKHWPTVPIASDINTLSYQKGTLYDGDTAIYSGAINLVCGGFPCQDISIANHAGKGIKGVRSGLWKQMLRLVSETSAELLAENVAMLRHRGLVTVLQDLWQIGYDAQWHIIPAKAVGTLHQRERLFLYSYPRSKRRKGGVSQPIQRSEEFSWLEDVRGIEDLRERSSLYTPMLCRSDDGIPNRVGRLRCLGNAVVPQVVKVMVNGEIKIC